MTGETSAVRFGIDTFGDVTRGPDGAPTPQAQVIRDVVEEAVLADQVGLDAVGIGEHHRGDFAVSAPDLLLAAIAARTSAHLARLRGHGAQLRRPRARVPAVRDARRHLRRPRRDHARPRLVHRVVPAVRLRPLPVRDALHGEARPLRPPAQRAARHVVRHHPRRADRPGGLPAHRVRRAADLDRRRRQPGVRRPRRAVRPADDARHHRRRSRPLPAATSSSTAARSASSSCRPCPWACTRPAMWARRRGGARRVLRGLQGDARPHRRGTAAGPR